MTTYNHPGVYIEETLTPLINVTADPGDFGAAFVGVSKGGGPVGPLLVTSWTQYQALYGGVSGLADELTYAASAFFNNSGGSAYIVRAVNSDATPASLTLNGSQVTPGPVLEITATAPGTWASDPTSVSRVYITISPSPESGSTRFDMVVEVGSNKTRTAREQFTDLTLDPSDPRYAPVIVNSVVVGSKYVSITNLTPDTTAFASNLNPTLTTKVPLTGGSEGTGTPDVVGAVQRLASIDRNLVINVPGLSSTELNSVVAWAQETGRHFVVADAPKPVFGETAEESVAAQVTFAESLTYSSHVAVYGPWVYQQDPNARAGSLRLTAPGGAVVGQYLRTDVSRGIFKAPAGIQTSLTGVVGPAHVYSNSEQDSLALAGINLIKPVPGSGICIMGARTQSVGYPDRYVSVRRFLISLKASLTAVTRFAIFENNNEDLWALVESTVDAFLLTRFQVGAFKGGDPEEAYFVRCDATNNTPADADAGILNIDIGVALQNPAEFIIIRLGQTQAGSTATDTL